MTAKSARELLDLIERNREAAAKLLGVPLDQLRQPKTTQEAAPIRRFIRQHAKFTEFSEFRSRF